MTSDLARAPVTVQLAAFERIIRGNPVVAAIVSRLATLELPAAYLTAGCLFQTVWNALAERAPTTGIRDYDLFYFDDRDLSWDAEDAVIRRCRTAFADLGADVEVRNQARVHLWYEQKFGTPCPRYTCTEAAIDSFAATTCCLGVRPDHTGALIVYAPHGLSDLFAYRLRPNPVVAPQHVYEAKAARWQTEWPRLEVLPWPAAARSGSSALP